MPPNKKRKAERAVIGLRCEFSLCEDECRGIDELRAHVGQHLTLMKEQLVEIQEDAVAELDSEKCECPWKDCNAVLNHQTDWEGCVRHILFHAFHTYLKGLGDDELSRRGVMIQCDIDTANRNHIPDLPTPFQCLWAECEFKTDDAWPYYRHAEAHGMNPSLDYSWSCHWSGCQYKAPTTSKLKDHIRHHTQERTYACSHCGTFFSTSTRLVDHQYRQATGDHSYQCSHCLKRFAAERILKDHLRKHVNLYGCIFCDMTSPSPSALRIHILFRHSTERPYNCSQCDKRFKTKHDLSSHATTHTLRGTTVSCLIEHCGFKCKNAQTLAKHHKEVHEDGGRVFGCHLCDKLFTSSRIISTHLRSEHKLSVPSGHSRFRFALDEDGVRRLVTVRYECVQEEGSTKPINCDDGDISMIPHDS